MRVLQCIMLCVLQRVAVCVLQCVVVCCSVLQCVRAHVREYVTPMHNMGCSFAKEPYKRQYSVKETYDFKDFSALGGTAYGLATISRLLKTIGLFCKRALPNRRYSAKETDNFSFKLKMHDSRQNAHLPANHRSLTRIRLVGSLKL